MQTSTGGLASFFAFLIHREALLTEGDRIAGV
jgi:hypothetical protein